MPGRSRKADMRVCLVPDCPAGGAPQPVVWTEHRENLLVAEWLPCGHMIAPPLPPEPAPPPPMQYGALS